MAYEHCSLSCDLPKGHAGTHGYGGAIPPGALKRTEPTNPEREARDEARTIVAQWMAKSNHSWEVDDDLTERFATALRAAADRATQAEQRAENAIRAAEKFEGDLHRAYEQRRQAEQKYEEQCRYAGKLKQQRIAAEQECRELRGIALQQWALREVAEHDHRTLSANVLATGARDARCRELEQECARLREELLNERAWRLGGHTTDCGYWHDHEDQDCTCKTVAVVAETRAREAQFRAALEQVRCPPFWTGSGGVKVCSWCAALAEGGRCHHTESCAIVIVGKALAAAPDEPLWVVRELMAASTVLAYGGYLTDFVDQEHMRQGVNNVTRLRDALAAAARLFGPASTC